MPMIVETTVYTFDELNDRAKQKARDWCRGDDGGLGYDWWDSVYDDANTIAALMGIDLNQRAAKLMGGGTRHEPAIFFSGFWSQGDGASFQAAYSHAKGSAKAVKAYAPLDTELHRIAAELQDLQRRHFYSLSGRVTTSGRYSHEYSMSLDLGDRHGDCNHETEQAVLELLRDFARWIYRTLEKEHEYLTSDEQVDETIRLNEYTFDEDGDRYDAPAAPVATCIPINA